MIRDVRVWNGTVTSLPPRFLASRAAVVGS